MASLCAIFQLFQWDGGAPEASREMEEDAGGDGAIGGAGVAFLVAEILWWLLGVTTATRNFQATEAYDKVCHLCGHVGFAAAIKTCSLCKVSSVHSYCLRIVLSEVPEVWHCEECLQNAEAAGNRQSSVKQEAAVGAISSASGKQEMQHSSHKSASRKIEAGKVKFIPDQEVAKLASGKRSHGNGKSYVSGCRGDFMDAKHSPTSGKTIMATSPSSKVPEAPFRSQLKQSIYPGVKLSPKHTMETKNAIKERESKAPLKPQGARLPLRKPGNISVPVKEQRQSREKTDAEGLPVNDLERNTPLQPQGDCLPIRKPGNTYGAVKEQRRSHQKKDAEGLPFNGFGTASCSVPQNKQISSQELLFPQKLVISSNEKHHYALEACWSGAFEVQGHASPVHCGVYAHFPCHVSPKAYDFSKQLPGTLKFKMLPRESVWPKIFKLHPPTKDDVALYFMCEVERYKQRYNQFVQHIDSNDYALQGCIADVELLLFTSARLQIDSQKFGGHFYFWGVFIHVKRKKAACYGELEAVPHNASTPAVNLKYEKSTILEGDSMEIDMVGNCHIGKIDTPTKLDAPPWFQKPVQRSPEGFIQKKSTNSALLDTPPPGFTMPVYKDERKDSAAKLSGQAPRQKRTNGSVSFNTAEDYAVKVSKNLR